MTTRDVQITGLGPVPSPDLAITISGTPINTNALQGFTLRAHADDVPIATLTLDLSVLDLSTVEGEMNATIPDATRDTLVALGWTPPTEDD